MLVGKQAELKIVSEQWREEGKNVIFKTKCKDSNNIAFNSTTIDISNSTTNTTRTSITKTTLANVTTTNTTATTTTTNTNTTTIIPL